MQAAQLLSGKWAGGQSGEVLDGQYGQWVVGCRYVAIRITKDRGGGGVMSAVGMHIRDRRLQRLKGVDAGAAVSHLLRNRSGSLAPSTPPSTPLLPFGLMPLMRFIPLQTSCMLFS